MRISMHDMTTGSFVPMLESLSSVLHKGEEHAKATNIELVNARLAPDMFTLAQQVQQACHYAKDATSRLTGKGGAPMDGTETTFAGFKAQIRRAVDILRNAPAAAFDGAEDRDCSIEIPGDLVIEMNGLRLLRSWSLPHFYFHVVTAYDILRHHGVVIGKQDYLGQVAGFIHPKK
jgi:uncharacterized protein